VGSLSRVLRALETTEKVLAALMFVPDRDDAIRRLIIAIDRDRAALLVAIFRRSGRKPKDVWKPLG
jgi:hypothetical protein